MFECKACIRGDCTFHTKRYAALCLKYKPAIEGFDFKFDVFGHVVPITHPTVPILEGK